MSAFHYGLLYPKAYSLAPGFDESNQGRANACRPVEFFRNCTQLGLRIRNVSFQLEGAAVLWISASRHLNLGFHVYGLGTQKPAAMG